MSDGRGLHTRDSQSKLLSNSSASSGDEAVAQISDMRCVDFEKSVVPNRDYVFVIEVTWSDGRTFRIRRNHEKLFQFQCQLLDAFPQQAGRDESSRILPFLPGKKLFRGNSKSVAVQRFPKIRDYVEKLKCLPDEIVHSDLVRGFFSPQAEDTVRSRSTEVLNKFTDDVSGQMKSHTLPSDARLPDSDDEEAFTATPAMQSEFRLLTM